MTTNADPQLLEKLRRSFKYFNRFMVGMWRLGMGPYVNWSPDVSGRVMVITHIGRKSGVKRQTPVNYDIVDGEIYCTAGFGSVSDWYRNILKNPQVEVWLPDGWWCGIAEDVSDSPDRLYLLRRVIRASGLAGYMFGLDARKMSDEEFDRATVPYRLVHIQRAEARTGSGGPGDLAWVWPLATMILLPLVLFRRSK